MYGTKGTAKPPEKWYSDELAGLERGPLEFLLIGIRATSGPFSVVRGREPGGGREVSNSPQNCDRQHFILHAYTLNI